MSNLTLTILKSLSIAATGVAFVTLGTSSPAQATSFLSTGSGQVGTIDSATGTFNPLSSSGVSFTDIALSSDNNLFGVTFSQLFNIDKITGASSLIGNLGSSINALGFSSGNVLYGAGYSSLYTINTSTGAASLIADISGFNSSGDLVFDPVNNRFLGTSGLFNGTPDTLFSISLNGTANPIGSIGFSDVYGLFFENGTLFGYTANREQITIDLTTGAGTFNKNVTGGSGFIWGAASLPSTGPSTSVSVPEPASVLGLLGLGALGVGSTMKRKLQQKG
ncbi:MAG TPA: hypothetical protein DEG17_03690 [Cyanobacteria bacterium UBA11149]|nr:hypothetical protein [Cyanobacteria bacterium UBA11367]HBE58256.1 hypothetical protein [Cyanobacteria bacterium UBA11366]HBK64186.1 hypothetical protein [Cyanobacteria bacterium UBA11166]HBR75634.1 hypothetical protein [Cyanobacteria bacterium UBA11159]HBS70781.1 hypothetical protein [Cyanobacteria bacterium UBA11153]HBW88006.1 hypothetical protein [Cyanobacteria bacterium UBA11149]HCA96896.1 hypothetical protein [Cyanobacteria bacterium UBA9226]